LLDCLITKADILHGEEILQSNLGSLGGKATKAPSKVMMNTREESSNKLLEKHGNVTLDINIMYINKTIFMITSSWAINFETTEIF